MVKGMFLARVSSPFELHPLADLFIQTPTRLLWKEVSHFAIIAQRMFIHISTAVIARYSFIQLSHHGGNEHAQSSKQ